MYFSQLFLSQTECYFAILVGSWSEQWWERATVRSERDVVPLSVPEPNTVHPLRLERQAPHYLPILASIWGENAALQSHFRGTVITRATHLNWKKRLSSSHLAFSPRVSYCTRLKTDRDEESSLFFFCSEKWKFEFERWSEASKGTCNWADLDRLSGNMKQQQLWRRVIASLGLYNALSSL